jgi:pimeloyl-ACP methyl ester carboxylesterase
MRQRIELPAGGRATHLVTGSGDPLLWFEGGPGFPADLGLPDVALFADTFRAFRVDPPGVEGSVMPSGVEPDHLGHAYFYEQARLNLNLPPVVAMGHSWGGLTALTYAAAYPQSVRGCVVINGFAGDPSVDPDEQPRSVGADSSTESHGRCWSALFSLSSSGSTPKALGTMIHTACDGVCTSTTPTARRPSITLAASSEQRPG